MQDNRTLHSLEILVKFATLFKGIPYEWDKRNKCLQISTGRAYIKICQFCSKFNVRAYLVYEIVRVVIEFSKPTPDFYNLIWLFIWILFYIWAVISFYNADVSCKDVTAMFKGVKKFDAEMQMSGEYYLWECPILITKLKPSISFLI